MGLSTGPTCGLREDQICPTASVASARRFPLARSAARNPVPGQRPRRPVHRPSAAPASARARVRRFGFQRRRPSPAAHWSAPGRSVSPDTPLAEILARPLTQSISSYLARALSPNAGAGPHIPSLAMAARSQAWQFAAALVIFHGSEYVLAAAFHGRRNVTATSLLISKQYVLAMSFAVLEHLTEALIFPELKEYRFVSHVGLLMVIIGEVVRKLAVVTAGHSFTHVIRIHYEDQHKLITHGVYRCAYCPLASSLMCQNIELNNMQ
ncbi:hypothetical protein GUJ93_ZPchr0004g39952 [Zizania palustris]|uniref:Protein-S-isoprenylcysteine O-methyltransferase n=1 Tax=Zizania palustris TaxID=103762 RepID=A0A8J5S759_ZIZPA|nr:hypothetical protein GUJ93_ZPchr0004g39952 [Zizania palustris]